MKISDDFSKIRIIVTIIVNAFISIKNKNLIKLMIYKDFNLIILLFYIHQTNKKRLKKKKNSSINLKIYLFVSKKIEDFIFKMNLIIWVI